MIRRIIKEAHWTYWFFVAVTLAVFLPMIYSDAYYLYKGAEIKYTKYENISLTVNRDYVEGKFNKHISIKDKNNRCYIEYCGFPKAGKYHIKEMTFIEIDGTPFLLRNCLNNKKCFYNLYNSQIEKMKNDEAFQRKGMIFLITLAILALLYRGWHDMNRNGDNSNKDRNHEMDEILNKYKVKD